MSYFHQFAFQIYPYIALAVFFIGSWLRFDRSMYTWRTGSSQMLSDKGMRVGSNLFHVGVIAILLGHLVGLLTPHAVYEHFITAPQKQLMAMVVGGVFGALCFIGISILLVRRLTNPRVRATAFPPGNPASASRRFAFAGSNARPWKLGSNPGTP